DPGRVHGGGAGGGSWLCPDREPLSDLRGRDHLSGILPGRAGHVPRRVGAERLGRAHRAHRPGRPAVRLPDRAPRRPARGAETPSEAARPTWMKRRTKEMQEPTVKEKGTLIIDEMMNVPFSFS